MIKNSGQKCQPSIKLALHNIPSQKEKDFRTEIKCCDILPQRVVHPALGFHEKPKPEAWHLVLALV
jgi:hypothetical protein